MQLHKPIHIVDICSNFGDFNDKKLITLLVSFHHLLIRYICVTIGLIKMQECLLIIDDDSEDCDLLKETLIEIGVKLPVYVVHDGPAAFKFLESLNGNLPRLIILDINMPIMNGLIVLSKLNLKYSIPVILYTTSCDADLVREAKDLGALDCVKKGVAYADNLRFAKRVSEFVGSFTQTTIY